MIARPSEKLDAMEITEGHEYLVVGIVLPKRSTEKPGLWARLRGATGQIDVNAGERWAQLYRADSARQAEDLARASVKHRNPNFRLHVGGVVDLDGEGKLRLADADENGTKYVDPDAEEV